MYKSIISLDEFIKWSSSVYTFTSLLTMSACSFDSVIVFTDSDVLDALILLKTNFLLTNFKPNIFSRLLSHNLCNSISFFKGTSFISSSLSELILYKYN